MSMRRRPQRGDHDDQAAFVKQATAAATTRLNCIIPTELHDQLRLTAARERTNMTELVVEALQTLFAERVGETTVPRPSPVRRGV